LPPVGDLDDLLAATRVIDTAYAASGWRTTRLVNSGASSSLRASVTTD
jgi:hypothetical protein